MILENSNENKFISLAFDNPRKSNICKIQYSKIHKIQIINRHKCQTNLLHGYREQSTLPLLVFIAHNNRDNTKKYYTHMHLSKNDRI